MKKSLIGIFILLTLFSSILIYAANETTSPILTSDKEAIKSDLTKTGQEVTSSFSGILANNVEIPEGIKFLPEILFGITETISISQFIIYSAIWILLFLIIVNIFSVIPIINGGLRWITATIVMLLMGLGGGIQQGSIIWMNFLSSISFFEKLSSWNVSILIVLLIIFYLITTKLSRLFKQSMQITQAGISGTRAGAAAAAAARAARRARLLNP